MINRLIKSNLILFLCLMFLSCDDKSQSITSNSSFLPNASGENNEMLLVMDSTKFKGKIGRSLVETYSSFITGLPQPETKYDLRFIKPRKFNNILKYAKNIVIAFTLEGKSIDSEILRKNFNNESLHKIENDSSLFYFVRRDQYAKGQLILYLFSKTDEDLHKKIEKNKSSLLKFFDDELDKRVSREIFSKTEKNISQKIEKDHNIKVKIPFGYDLAKNIISENMNFFWLRQLDPEYEKNIYVFYDDYSKTKIDGLNKIFHATEPDVYPLRNFISKKFLIDSEKSNIFMDIQSIFPINYEKINLNGNLAVISKGLWKLSDISAGGPFQSITVYNKKLDRIYYIEGYVYAPGSKKREFMQEISSILKTFEL